jgi:hypothetical protein
MGFYNKNLFLRLPNKMAIIDTLERTGEPNSESFSPYVGMNYLITAQMIGPKYGNVNFDIIKEYIISTRNDFKPDKIKGQIDYKSREDSNDFESSKKDNYEIFLENIDERYITDSLKSMLIGMKLNYKNDINLAANATLKVQADMYDKETGKPFNQSDVYVEDLSHKDVYNRHELRSRLAFLLKKLQDGSKQFGISLLSMFAALDGIRSLKGPYEDIKPNEILQFPIYNVNSNGDLTSKVDPLSANATRKFINAKNLILGLPYDSKDKDNNNLAKYYSLYYNTGIRLINTIKELGYNLYEEDITEYTSIVIESLLVDYIMSNEELLEDMSICDPNILNVLRDNNIIFNRPTIYHEKLEEQMSKEQKHISLRNMARIKSQMISFKREESNKINAESEHVSLINKFFTVYNKTFPKSFIEEKCTEDCCIINNVLCDSSHNPLIFKDNAWLLMLGNDTPGFSSIHFIITSDAKVIKLDNENDLIYATLSSLLRVIYEKDYSLLDRGVK